MRQWSLQPSLTTEIKINKNIENSFFKQNKKIEYNLKYLPVDMDLGPCCVEQYDQNVWWNSETETFKPE